MINEENIKLVNLCVDESGVASVGIFQHRFFLMTAVVISPDQQELAGLLFAKWRKKYLNNPIKSFHAADFFEDFEDGYKKVELKIQKNFKKAIKELNDILDHVEFKAKVFFVDLPELRKDLGIKNAPDYKSEFKSEEEKKVYTTKRKEFQEYFEQSHAGSKDIPYALPLFNTFLYHQEIMEDIEKKDTFKRKAIGFIFFESLSGADTKAISNYHKYKEKVGNGYSKRIVGINFPTKNSLDGGIEIADYISYISCQTLRAQHRVYSETKNISSKLKETLRELRDFMRETCKVEIINVTKFNLPKTKKASSR